MSFSSHRGCLYTCTKCLHVYIPIFTFYALELGRMLHVFYIASFSMYVDEWLNGLSMQIFSKHFLLKNTCYLFSVIDLLGEICSFFNFIKMLVKCTMFLSS